MNKKFTFLKKSLLTMAFILGYLSVWGAASVTLRPTHVDISATTAESAVLVTLSNYSLDDARYRLYNGSNQYNCWDASSSAYISATGYGSGPKVIGTPTTSTSFWILYQRGNNNNTAASYRDRLGTGYSSNYSTQALPAATAITSPYTLSGTFVGVGSYDNTAKHVVLAYNGETLVSATSTTLTTGVFSIVTPDGTTIDKIEVRTVSNETIASVTGSWTTSTNVGSIPDSSNPTVLAPTFTPPGGDYFLPQSVTLSTSTDGATIRYTTDGEDPTETSDEYTGAIAVSSTSTIKAKAWKDGMDASSIASATYTFPETVTTIADLRTKAVSTPVIYTGTAVVTFAATSTNGNRNTKYIQDATGAIVIDDLSGAITGVYAIGDQITNIGGELALYNGMLQFVPEIDATKLGTAAITPQEIALDALSTTNQAQLVTINNITLDNSGSTFVKGTNVTITGATDIVLRPQYFDLDYIGEAIPAAPQNITGVVLAFNSTIQLVPRSKADIVASTSVGITPEEVVKEKSVVAKPGIITVSASAGELIQVYDILGKAVKSVKASSSLTDIPVKANQLLIVKIGNNVSKVITK